MSKHDTWTVRDLDAAEIEQITGGMNLPPYSPNIRVEDQRHYHYFYGPSTGPLIGGYVFA